MVKLMEHLEPLETIGSAAQVTNQARSTNGGAQTVQLPRRGAYGRAIFMERSGDPRIFPLVNSHIFLWKDPAFLMAKSW